MLFVRPLLFGFGPSPATTCFTDDAKIEQGPPHEGSHGENFGTVW